MNFLKKKIKGAVKKVGGADDEDVEDAAYERQLALAAAAEAGLSHAIPPPNALPPAPVVLPPKGELPFPLPDSSTEKAGTNSEPLPLPPLPTEPVEEPRLQINKDTEEWKFFEQLTQRVQTTVKTTQSTLTKIKETSAIPEIIKKLEEEDKPIFLEEPPEELGKPGVCVVEHSEKRENGSAAVSPIGDLDPWPTGSLDFPAKLNWVNFADSEESESESKKLSSTKATVAAKEKTPSPIAEKPIQSNTENLLDDFGFESRPTAVSVTETKVTVVPTTLDFGFLDEEEDETGLDPFDTSFVNLKAPANTCVRNTPCNDILEEEEEELPDADDPFNTVHAERVIRRSESYLSNISRLTSPGEDMSNPFIIDDITAARPPGAPTPGESLFSSTDVSPVDMPEDVANFFTNCSRRSSANPFDAEEINFLREKVSAVAADQAGVDTVKSGAALLEAIANEFAGKDKEDDDLFAATIGGVSAKDVPSPLTPMDPFGDQVVPQTETSSAFAGFGETSLQPNKQPTAIPSSQPFGANDPFDSGAFGTSEPEAAASNTFASAFEETPQAKLETTVTTVTHDPFGAFDEPMSITTEATLAQRDEKQFDNVNEPHISERSVPEIIGDPLSPPADAFQAAFGKKSIDLDDLPADAKTPTDPFPAATFDPFSGLSGSLPVPTTLPAPASAVGSPLEEQDTAMDTQNDTTGLTEMAETTVESPKAVIPSIISPKNEVAQPEIITESTSFDAFGSFNNALPTEEPAAPVVVSQPTTLDVFGDSHKPVDDKTPSVDIFGSFNTTNKDLFGDSQTEYSFAPPVSSTVTSSFFGEPDNVVEQTSTTFDVFKSSSAATSDLFGDISMDTTAAGPDPFDTTNITLDAIQNAVPYSSTAAFEDFASKFDQVGDNIDNTLGGVDAFGTSYSKANTKSTSKGFEGMDLFDPFAAPTKAPQNTPAKMPLGSTKQESKDSFDDDDEETNFAVVIKPKMRDNKQAGGTAALGPPPKLMPPPKSPARTAQSGGGDEYVSTLSKKLGSAREAMNDDDLFLALENDTTTAKRKDSNEFAMFETDTGLPPALGESGAKQAAEVESPSTPLFDDDTSQPLEPFTTKFEADGWEFLIRHPNKKKITAQRFWKPVYVRMTDQNIIYILNKKEDNDPFQEFPLQGCYSVSEIGAQQFDAYSKIFTVKLQYIFYKERVGVRPGQVAKVMQGQITSMGQIAKLGLPLEHAPQVTELLKLGTQKIQDFKTFTQVVEDALFHLNVHRDRALTYKTEEIQVTVIDEFYVEQDHTGHVSKQKARVRLFCLAFLNGMPDVEIGVNDMRRQGKEVVGRYDIMPIVTEEWIRLEECEFHACVSQEDFEACQIIKVHPPDAMHFEMMRFRIRPPKRRELPIQIKAVLKVAPPKVELRADVLVPGFSSRKHGQIPCEDIAIYFPIPECWVYFFRVEKHFRYGALKSASRRPGKIKGLERIMGAAQNLEQHHLIEASAGTAKYEHAHKAIVWRIPRLPKEGQGAYTQQLMVLRLNLTNYDQIPSTFENIINVDFTMPASTVSHCVVRSISCNTDEPPEKFVRYVARHEYKVGMEVIVGTSDSDLIKDAAAMAMPSHANGSPPQIPTPQSQHDDDFD